MSVESDRFTRDDLEAASVQVEALRQDLAGYRAATERALTRRNLALIIAAVGLVLLLALQTVGGLLILRHEEHRAEGLRETARLLACQEAAELRGDIVAVLVAARSDEEVGGAARADRLAEAIEQLRPDACTLEATEDGAS